MASVTVLTPSCMTKMLSHFHKAFIKTLLYMSRDVSTVPSHKVMKQRNQTGSETDVSHDVT
jgi:hypothetical protein